MCDVTFGREKVMCVVSVAKALTCWFILSDVCNAPLSHCRYPILMRYACSWMQRFSTSCKFNKHRNRRNYEYVYGRRIIFGLCKCFSHMQFMGRTKKILLSWKGICCIFFASWFWKRRYSANLTSFWHSNKWKSSENKLSLGPSRVCTRKILHSREQEKLPPSLINVGYSHLT